VLGSIDADKDAINTMQSALQGKTSYKSRMVDHLRKVRLRWASNCSNTLKQMIRSNKDDLERVKPPVNHLNAPSADIENEESVKIKLGVLFGEGSITAVAKNVKPEDRRRYSLSKDTIGEECHVKNTDDTLAIQYMNTGLRYDKAGDYGSAIRNYGQAHTLRLNKYGANHKYTKQTLRAMMMGEANIAQMEKADRDNRNSLHRGVSMKVQKKMEGFENVQTYINPIAPLKSMKRVEAAHVGKHSPIGKYVQPPLLTGNPPAPSPPRLNTTKSGQEIVSDLRAQGRVDEEMELNYFDNTRSINESDSRPHPLALKIGRRVNNGHARIDNLTNRRSSHGSNSGKPSNGAQRVKSNRSISIRRHSRLLANRHFKKQDREEPNASSSHTHGTDKRYLEDDYALFGNMQDDFLIPTPILS